MSQQKNLEHVLLTREQPEDLLDNSGYTMITAYGEKFFMIPHNMLEGNTLKFEYYLNGKTKKLILDR